MADVYCQLLFATKALRQRGCGAAACIQALHVQSGGSWKASGSNGTTSAQVRVARSGIGRAFNHRGLRPSEVYASMRAVAATGARMDVPVQHRSGVRASDLLAQLDRTGAVAIVAVDYSAVQAAGKGATSFRGMHWVTVLKRHGDEVEVADPLRRRTVRWPVTLLARAMGRFGSRPWGGDRGEAIVVGKWRTWRQGYALKAAEARAATNEAVALRRALAACEAAA